MLEFTVTNGHGHIRIIRPLANESEEDFRRRMDAMAHVLAEQAPNLIAIVMMDGDGCPVCLVSHRTRRDPRA